MCHSRHRPRRARSLSGHTANVTNSYNWKTRLDATVRNVSMRNYGNTSKYTTASRTNQKYGSSCVAQSPPVWGCVGWTPGYGLWDPVRVRRRARHDHSHTRPGAPRASQVVATLDPSLTRVSGPP